MGNYEVMGILIFGGTGDAVVGAERIVSYLQSVGAYVPCVYSLAGVTKNPHVPENVTVHSGGFGGVAGIVSYILQHNIHTVFDFTHPYATQISDNISHALCELSVNNYNIHLYGYNRPAWHRNENIHYMPTVQQIAHVTRNISGTMFVALGAKDAPLFFNHTAKIVVRAMKNISVPNGDGIIAPPPTEFTSESALFDTHNFTAIICKDSGTKNGYYKIQLALDRNIPIYMHERPKHNRLIYDKTIVATDIKTTVEAFIGNFNKGLIR